MCCCQFSSFCYSITFSVIICIELACGLVATTTTAFAYDKGNTWAWIILAVDLAFAAWLLYFTRQELLHNKKRSSTLNAICGMCTVLTIAIFMTVFFAATPSKNIFVGCLIVYGATALVLCVVVTCYMCDERNILDIPLRRFSVPRQQQEVENKSSGADNENPNEKSLEESLLQIVTHVQNNPTQKSYVLHTVGARGNGASFVVTM